jgi:hypothetical protein
MMKGDMGPIGDRVSLVCVTGGVTDCGTTIESRTVHTFQDV